MREMRSNRVIARLYRNIGDQLFDLAGNRISSFCDLHARSSDGDEMMNDNEPADIDPLEELRRYRESQTAKFNYDYDAFFRDLKEKERASGRTYVSFSDKPEDPERTRELMAPCDREFGMTGDPIIDEIRKFRDEHAAKFNYDIGAIVRDLQERQRAGGRQIISPPATPTTAHSDIDITEAR
jgi:hypothetical protein